MYVHLDSVSIADLDPMMLTRNRSPFGEGQLRRPDSLEPQQQASSRVSSATTGQQIPGELAARPTSFFWFGSCCGSDTLADGSADFKTGKKRYHMLLIL